MPMGTMYRTFSTSWDGCGKIEILHHVVEPMSEESLGRWYMNTLDSFECCTNLSKLKPGEPFKLEYGLPHISEWEDKDDTIYMIYDEEDIAELIAFLSGPRGTPL